MKALGVSIVLFLVAGCASQSGNTDGSEPSEPVSSTGGTVRYECYTFVGSKHVLTLPVAPLDADVGMVTVRFHGDPTEAMYERTGLTQLWIFEDDLYVKVDPDLTAAYMDFRGAEDGEVRKPQAVFECKKKSR